MEQIVTANVASGITTEGSFDQVLDHLDLNGHEPELLCAFYSQPGAELVFQVDAPGRRAKRLVRKVVEAALRGAGVETLVTYTVEEPETEEEGAASVVASFFSFFSLLTMEPVTPRRLGIAVALTLVAMFGAEVTHNLNTIRRTTTLAVLCLGISVMELTID